MLLLELLRYDLSLSIRGLRHLPVSLLASKDWVLRLLTHSGLACIADVAQAAASAGLAEGKLLMASAKRVSSPLLAAAAVCWPRDAWVCLFTAFWEGDKQGLR